MLLGWGYRIAWGSQLLVLEVAAESLDCTRQHELLQARHRQLYSEQRWAFGCTREADELVVGSSSWEEAWLAPTVDEAMAVVAAVG